ncbi:50S ribosomal protein L25/general stress protein Ctc [Syntrophobacter fumaroxidans]|nr:50S ribosomal protein L25/general stress protein Ctc [Syntrophobacter fumaroxidans]
MSMDIELVAQTRTKSGKGPARALRRNEMVPAVLYGPKAETVSLSVPRQRLERLLRDMGEESKLLRLTVEGDGTAEMKQVLIREVQVHPVRRRFLHVDFYEVPLDHPIVVEVPVELLGEPVGVKKGGTLNLIQRMLSVRCLPGEIPEKVQVDVSKLDIGSSIQVEQLRTIVPFELTDDGGMAVVNVVAPEGAGKEDAEAAEE